MRLLLVIDSLGAGGAESQLVLLLRYLDHERFHAKVLLLHGPQTVPPHFQLTIEALGVPVHTLDMPFPPLRPRPLAQGWRRYRAFLRDDHPHIVHSLLFASNVLTRLGRPGAPRHRLFNTAQEQTYSSRRLRLRRLTDFLHDHTIANSDHTAHLIKRGTGLSPQRMMTIPLGLEAQAFERNPTPQLRQERYPEAAFIGLTVARLVPLKGHGVLLDALASLREAGHLPEGYLHICLGAMHDLAYAQVLRQRTRTLGLEDVVIWQDAVQNVAAYYHMADLLVHPSHAESFGLVPVEAMLTRTPVLISDAANASKAVLDGETGWLFPDGDVRALAERLRHSFDVLPPSELIERAYQRARQYDAQRMADAHMTLYAR